MRTQLPTLILAIASLLITSACASNERASGGDPTPAPALAQTAEQASRAIVEAAEALLETLSDQERARLLYDFTDEAQRRRWSNLPTNMVERGGLR